MRIIGKKIDTSSVGIIVQGEKKADTIKIELQKMYEEIDLSLFEFTIYAKSEKETLASQALTKTVNADMITLTWSITQDFTAVDGALRLEIWGVNGDKIIKFTGDPINVKQTISIDKTIPTPILEQALANMQVLSNEAAQSAQIATEKANIATAAQLNPPELIDGFWWVFDINTSKYVNSGEKALGEKPNHQWLGTSLQIENPDGSWGEAVELKGQDGTGAGDMTKVVYDANNNGIVDNAEKLGGQLPTYYAKQSDIGDLITLKTTDKSNLVGAVNEVHSKLYNPNLLDNAYFELKEAIVNQKGIASGWVAPTSMYFIDRWRSYIDVANNTTFTFETNGLGVQVSEGYGGIAQMLEFSPTGGMYTFSAIIDGVLSTLTFDASTWNTAQTGTAIKLSVLTYYDRKTVRILFYDTVKHIIQRVKLEKGTISTILNDPPQDYGDTLRKCQRYYRTYGSGLVGIALNSTTMHVILNFENEMRITPNPVLLTTTINFFGTADVQATNATATFYGDKKGGALAVTGFTGLVAGGVYRSNQAGWLALDANL